jgi:hypothetical protein
MLLSPPSSFLKWPYSTAARYPAFRSQITLLSRVAILRHYKSTTLPQPSLNRTQGHISTVDSTTELVGQSGRHYHIERVLQEKEFPNGISPLRVYLAT